MGSQIGFRIYSHYSKRFLMTSLLVTLQHRPYVFLFLISFLVIGILNRGIGRTFLFLFLGFWIAWISEYSSIRNGFPYGMYHYLYDNMTGEMMLGGVPVWDSLSYTFLAYAAYEMATWKTSGGARKGFWLRFSEDKTFSKRQDPTSLKCALFMLTLDIVADPLAVRGDQWFLGKIFYYEHPGFYFGVPLSNFAGWLLVAFCIFSSYHFLGKKLFSSQEPKKYLFLGPLFYGSIVVFNLVITFWIGEWKLGLAGMILHAFIFLSLLIRKKMCRSELNQLRKIPDNK